MIKSLMSICLWLGLQLGDPSSPAVYLVPEEGYVLLGDVFKTYTHAPFGGRDTVIV